MMSEFPPSLSWCHILLGHHQALQVGGVDHALIDLHLSEGIVDLGGGELDTEGHEGVSEGIGIDLAINLEGFEGGKDDVVVVGSSGHLGGEEGDHLGEVHGSVHLIEHGLGLSTANVLAVGTEGSDEIGGGEEAVLVSVHDAEGLLELLDGRVGEGVENVGYDFRDAPLSYQYFTSLHWSLTQFTPASMEVTPK